MVAANLLVAHDDRADFEALNVGSGRGTTVREYAPQLARATGRQIVPLIPGNFRVGDNRHSVSSIAKLSALGWAPKKSLDDIMLDYWEWLQSSGMWSRFDTNADADMERNGVVCAAALN